MGTHLSCISQKNPDKLSAAGFCDPYTIKDYIIEDTCLINTSKPKHAMPFSAYSEKTQRNGHASPGKVPQPEKFINQLPERSSPVLISRRMKNGQCRRASASNASSSCSPMHRAYPQNPNVMCMNLNLPKRQSVHTDSFLDYSNGRILAHSIPGKSVSSPVRDGDYVKVQRREKSTGNPQQPLANRNSVTSPIHSVGDRSSMGSRQFATVSQRFSFSCEPENMPRLVLQSTPIPNDAAIPLATPIPTPPPTPPVRIQSRSDPSTSAMANTKGSLTSIVNYLKRQSYADNESLFKVTLRKSRSRSTRRRDGPKIRYLPAISQSPNSREDTDRPNVFYRPRYYQHRRSLIEGLEKLQILADDPSDGLDLNLRKPGGRRDSCPGAIVDFNPEDFNRSASFHGTNSKKPSNVRAMQTLRKSRTMSRPRDGPAPKSPQPTHRKDPKKHAFYYFHIRSSNVHETECFLFGEVVTGLAQRYYCSLKLLLPSETPDLPEGLRRVEVAGPSLRDIKKFLYYLTTSEETTSLQRQIQERHTLARKLSRATDYDKSDSASPCSPRDPTQDLPGSSGSSHCPTGACFLPKGYV